MPRKKRQLKADLRRTGFLEDKDRGKVSHSIWHHPEFPDVAVVIAGHDGDDAKPYDEQNVSRVIAEVQRRRGVS